MRLLNKLVLISCKLCMKWILIPIAITLAYIILKFEDIEGLEKIEDGFNKIMETSR